MLLGGHLFLSSWLGPSSASAHVLLRALDQASESTLLRCTGPGEPGRSPGVESVGGSLASCSAQVVPRHSVKPLHVTRRCLQTWYHPQSAFFTWLGCLWSVSLGEGELCLKKWPWRRLP